MADYNHDEIKRKKSLLLLSREILKKEFVGIDTVIDKVIDSISTWFIFPELQETPVIINLWGMTGVGKTALVSRLSYLLEFDKNFFRYDMGDNSNGSESLRDHLENMFEYNNGMPCMIVLDEFQYAKTKNESDREIENKHTRVVWDLLDSGKIPVMKYHRKQVDKIAAIRTLLNHAVDEGVKVRNGLVIENETIFLELVNSSGDSDYEYESDENKHLTTVDDKRAVQFLPKFVISDLFQSLQLKQQSIIQFKKRIFTLSGLQTIEMLDKAIETATGNNIIDCTKSVIFILGNLDEAYTMSSTFNPDINADEFHEASKQLNINHIKRALKKRFRNEQISRLGNNHIIYPAFNEDSFRKLIELELSKVGEKSKARFGLQLAFTISFRDLIYREGVFPTQGSRPLLSTIYNLVNTKIPVLASENIFKNLSADKVLFDFTEGKINYEFEKEGLPLYNLEEATEFNMENLRKPAKDDIQAITAVHESGHAIIAMRALKILPEYLCSTSADTESMGFTVIKNKWKYFAKEEVVPRIATNMAGWIAEKIIFGPEKITKGAQGDIVTATDYATSAIKEYGMGALAASISTAECITKYYYHDNTGEHNAEVKSLLQEGVLLAEKILLAEKTLLLEMSDFLSDERIIKKEAIEKMVREFGSAELRNMVFIEDGNHSYYRSRLKMQIAEKNKEVLRQQTISEQSIISLNKMGG